MAKNQRMDKFEKEMELREDVDALKRLSALKSDPQRLKKAQNKLREEQKQTEGAVEAASGLRRGKK